MTTPNYSSDGLEGGHRRRQNPTDRWKRVIIVQRVLPHYRIRFFQDLHLALKKCRIHLLLLYGQELPGATPKTVNLNADWAIRIENRYLNFWGQQAIWQPIFPMAAAADLVVVEQSNQLLVNYALLFLRLFGRTKFAYWGHGKNFQGTSHPLSEVFKRLLLKSADWWFAYTTLSVRHIVAQGFPEARITDVQNSIDTSGLRDALDECEKKTSANLRGSLGLRGENVLLYCGGLYDQKQLPFLINACRRIWNRKPDIELVIVGDGPDRPLVEAAARENDWVHYAGPKYGVELAPYLKVAKAILMPGLVGLAIVDSFVAEIPLFTTNIPIHSPEIAYLIHQKTGFVTSFDENDYSDAVLAYLESPKQQAAIRQELQLAGAKFTHDAMVERFTAGVVQALGAKD